MNRSYVVESDAIITRNKAEQIANKARDNDCVKLDLRNVEFISRSVADELIHQKEHQDLNLVGVQEPVQSLLDAIADGRPPVAP